MTFLSVLPDAWKATDAIRISKFTRNYVDIFVHRYIYSLKSGKQL